MEVGRVDSTKGTLPVVFNYGYVSVPYATSETVFDSYNAVTAEEAFSLHGAVHLSPWSCWRVRLYRHMGSCNVDVQLIFLRP